MISCLQKMSQSKHKDKATIHTDGSCSNNPGNGGWAAIIIYKNRNKKKYYGGE